MLLVPLLAASEFKCQLNAYNFVAVTECFYERVLDRQGGLPWHRCAPLSSRVTFILECVTAPVNLTVLCSPAQVSRCSYFLNVIVCVCVCSNTCLVVALGHRQVQVPPKQTSCTTRSLDVCARVCTCPRACTCVCM